MILRTEKLSKQFDGLQAISSVDFELAEGEVRRFVPDSGPPNLLHPTYHWSHRLFPGRVADKLSTYVNSLSAMPFTTLEPSSFQLTSTYMQARLHAHVDQLN